MLLPGSFQNLPLRTFNTGSGHFAGCATVVGAWECPRSGSGLLEHHREPIKHLNLAAMHSYIEDTRYAVTSLIDALTADRIELTRLQDEQKAALSKEAYFDIAFMQRQMHSHANYWHGMMAEARMVRTALDTEVARLEARILDKKFSLSALAGALLQIAKQGISVVRGRPDNCTDGREVCGCPLKWVIWAGRNQSLHFEQVKMIDDKTADVLVKMGETGGSAALKLPRAGVNLAYEVVEALNWFSPEAYADDMESLLG